MTVILSGGGAARPGIERHTKDTKSNDHGGWAISGDSSEHETDLGTTLAA